MYTNASDKQIIISNRYIVLMNECFVPITMFWLLQNFDLNEILNWVFRKKQMVFRFELWKALVYFPTSISVSLSL